MTGQTKKEGTIAVVAKTGGIKLKDDPETWINSADSTARSQAREELKGHKVTLYLNDRGQYTKIESDGSTEGQSSGSEEPLSAGEEQAKRLRELSDKAKQQAKAGNTGGGPASRRGFGKPIMPEDISEEQRKREEGTGIEIARKHGHVVGMQGNEFIKYVGLLDIAHSMGIRKTDTDIKSVDFRAHSAVVKATVVMQDGKEYSALGDATPENMNKGILPHFIRMAETRALARVLRQATNIGMTSLEELQEGRPSDQKPTANTTTEEKTRGEDE